MLSRRELLRTVPLAAVAGTLPTRLLAQDSAAERFPGMIVRQERPQNLESPLSALQQEHVPNEHFFVRSHFAVPELDAKGFKLSVEGHVERKLELTLADLKKMEAVTKSIMLECAGNGRVFLTPSVNGLQWGHGAAGNAKWTGVPLGAVLEQAGVKRGAAEVVLIGADSGGVSDPGLGAIPFGRSVSLAKAKADETLLVWEMNGEPLPASHGAPLRAVVGGWYGMASVKWLTRVVVTDKPNDGYWQTLSYTQWTRDGAAAQLTPVTAIEPKAVITSPAPASIVKAGSDVTITGVAWAGENAVAKVEISTDGGQTWTAVKLPKSEPFAWTQWRWTWAAPKNAGPVQLLARCTDTKNRTQPKTRDPLRRSYMINHLIPVEVTVK